MPPVADISWESTSRHQVFDAWLGDVAKAHDLQADSLRVASADASARRYFRINDHAGRSLVIMDAPPTGDDNAAFVRVAELMHAAGIRAPQVLQWQRDAGFLLLTDLGERTLLQVLDPDDTAAAQALYRAALPPLLQWQQASRPDVLPPYDAALLRRELMLFPRWYVQAHRKASLSAAQEQTLQQVFDAIIARNLAGPRVFVHRDYMPRNLMLADGATVEPGLSLGVLDFQDAVCGPVTYDIASLLRDAFISWDEEFVLDITIRYWERARKLGLLDFDGWSQDFSSFWQAVEWMGLQRHLKVAGIFARLTLRDGKPRYLADAPRFMAYIRHTARRYRPLAPLLPLLDEIEGVQPATGWSFGRMA